MVAVASESPPVLSLTGLIQGQEGESVHMDVSFPPSRHTASHSTFAIQSTHTHTHTHTHTLDQCQHVKSI